MKKKLLLWLGWFGVLTPVYVAGVLTVLFLTSSTTPILLMQLVGGSAINCYVGRRLLKFHAILNSKKKLKQAKKMSVGELMR